MFTKTFVYPASHPTEQWLGYDGQFVMTITNTGTRASGQVTITDTLDPMLQNAFATLDPGNGTCAMGAGALSCTLPTIPVGGTRTVTVSYLLEFQPDGAGSLLNCAVATDSVGKAMQSCSTLLFAFGPG